MNRCLCRWLPLPALMLCMPGARAAGPVRVALLVHRVVNQGGVEASSVTAGCILPTSNRYQDVIELKIDPEPAETRTDGEGQRVVTVPLGAIAPGRSSAVRVMAWVRLKPVTVRLGLAAPDFEPLGPKVREAYLRDNELLQLAKVRPIAEKVVGAKIRDLDKARALYDYMAEHCRYDIDLKVDPADTVLAGKPGSCSELAYTYVALCRSVGIPARLVSAYVNRLGSDPSTDWRAHRWAEIHADKIGWVPVDPTHRINNPSQNFFGRQEGKYLTVVDDGSALPSGLEPGWHAFVVYAGPAAVKLEGGRSAVWRASTNRPGEGQLFAQACSALRHPDVAVRRQAVEEWDRQGHPLRVAFLLEALFDADAQLRRAAAGAIGRSGDISVMLALMKQAKAETDAGVSKALLDAARQLLGTADADRRATAVGELAKSRTDDGLELLDGIWKDPDRGVRKTAAQMLYKFGDKPGVHENYRRLTEDEDEFVRILAALRWSRVGADEALAAVVDLLESEVRWDREKALAELKKHTGETFGFDARSRPTTKRNREALSGFRAWLDRRRQGK